MKPAVRRVLTSKYFLIPVVSVLFYTLAGFVMAPLVIRWYVPRYVRNNLQCQAVLNEVRMNPFLLTLEARGFELKQPDGSPLVSFERFFVDLEMKSLIRWAAVFREVRLENPVAHVIILPGGGLNLQALAPKAKQAKEPEKPDSKPFRMLLQNIAVIGGKISVLDRRQSKAAELTVEMFDLKLKDLSTLQDHNGTYLFTTTTPEGEKFQWQGEITLVPFRSWGKIAINGLRAETLWEFVRDSVRLKPPKGLLNAVLEYRLDATRSPMQCVLEGVHLDLSDLALELADSAPAFLELKRVEVEAPRLDLVEKTIQVAKLLLDGGALNVHIDPSGRINVQRIAGEVERKRENEIKTSAPEPLTSPSPEADAPAPVESPFKVDAELVEIKDIALAFNDLSRATPVKAGFSNIDFHFKASIQAGAKELAGTLSDISSTIKDLHISDSRSAEPLFRAGKFTIEGGECDLGAHSVMVPRVALKEGNLDVSRDSEGQINWMKLMAAKNAAAESEPSRAGSGSKSPWKVLVKSFEMEGFRSRLSDLATRPDAPLFNVQNFNARLSDVDGKSPMGFAVDFQLEQGGSVSLSGKVDPEHPSVEAQVKVVDLGLEPLQPYLEPFVDLVLQSGAVSTQGNLSYAVPGGVANLAYDGSFGLSKLNLVDPDSKETYLGLGALQVPGLKLNLQPNRFEAEEVKLSGLEGELIIQEDKTVSLTRVIKKQPGQEKAQSESGGKDQTGEEGFPFRIGKVQVRDGNVLFADLSLRPKFSARIHDLKGTVTGLSSAKDARTRVQLDGRVDRYGLARINGVMQLYDFQRSTELDMAFQNVEMTALSPYSGKFAGRRIKSGRLSTDLKYRIQNRKLVGDNKIIVDNLELGDHVDSPDATNLPLDLAIALLKDSQGRIDIGLPVTGDLDNPEFSIGPLIWKAFASLITRVVTAPFRALGALFGGKGEEFKAVDFDPGSSEVLPPEKEKLEKLAGALLKRPQLKLLLQGRYSPEADGTELKDLRVRREIAKRLGTELGPEEDPGPPDLSDSKTRKSLEDMFEERFGKQALDELDQGIKSGAVKPRAPEVRQPEPSKRRKKGFFSKMANNLKLYKLVPGGKSPEEATAWAGELYVRLVESEPLSDEVLLKLANDRAQAIAEELERGGKIPADRISVQKPEPSTDEGAPSVSLSLGAL